MGSQAKCVQVERQHQLFKGALQTNREICVSDRSMGNEEFLGNRGLEWGYAQFYGGKYTRQLTNIIHLFVILENRLL